MTNRVFLVRRLEVLNDSWSEHDCTFEEAVDRAAAKVADGRASSTGFEVIEMSEVRRVVVRPEVIRVVVDRDVEATS